MILVEAVRGERVESVHAGAFVFLDPSGAVVSSAGAVDVAVLPRSSLKPLQAVALVEAGFPGRDEALALASASHDGEDGHIAGARAILAGAGLTEDALQCPADLPSGRAALLAWAGAGGGFAAVCHNCSGKHAAMLATCVAAGWPTSSYRDVAHPLQVAIAARIASLSGGAVAGVEVDGCGAPAFALDLVSLARGFAALAQAREGAPALVADAIRAHPRLLGGAERAVSQLLAATPGLVAKEGAEGVWAAALPDGRAFAAKLDDGGARALPPVLAAALRSWGIDNEAVARWLTPAVLGGGRRVGELRPSAEFAAALRL